MKKFYELIGKITVGLIVWGVSVYGLIRLTIIILDNCCTTLR